jgi:hypothetical protein
MRSAISSAGFRFRVAALTLMTVDVLIASPVSAQAAWSGAISLGFSAPPSSLALAFRPPPNARRLALPAKRRPSIRCLPERPGS